MNHFYTTRHQIYNFEYAHHPNTFSAWGIFWLVTTLIVLFALTWLLLHWILERCWWQDILEGLDNTDQIVINAKKGANESNKKILPALDFTENEYRWTLLYDHIREGQITPKNLHHMRRIDLEFLAGMYFSHPDLLEPQRKGESKKIADKRHEQLTKVLGNAIRAKAELQKRNLLWATGITASVALVSAIVGALLANIGRL